VRALPGHFQNRSVAAGHGGRDRAGGIRERRLPALEQLDDLLGVLDLALCPELVVVASELSSPRICSQSPLLKASICLRAILTSSSAVNASVCSAVIQLLLLFDRMLERAALG
jgi:hypothetical protein